MQDRPVAFNIVSPATPSRTARPAAADVWTIAIYAFVCVWTAAWFFHGWGYWEDDAFIHLEYARSLTEGRGFEFNGLVSYGDTSPLWVLLLILAHAVWSDWIVAGKILMAMSAVAAFAAIRDVAMALAPDTVASRPRFAALMVLLVALNPYFVYWSASGMEAVLAIAVGLWIVRIATIGPASGPLFCIGCLLAGLAPLLRPEFVLLNVLVAPFFLMRALTLLAGRPAVQWVAVFALAMLLAAGPVTGWLLYAHHVFGTFVPNTSAAKMAKVAFNGGSPLGRIGTVSGFGFPVVTAVVLALPIVFAALLLRHDGRARLARGLRRTPAAVWVIVAWALATCAFYVVNTTYVQTRYVLVFAPAVTIVVFLLIATYGRRWLYVTACVFGAGAAALVSLAVAGPFIGNKVAGAKELENLSAYIRAHVPPKAPVAIFDIGGVAFKTRHPLVDTGGITRPSVLPFMTSPAAVVEWAKREGATHFVMSTPPEPDAILLYEAHTPFQQWTLDPRKFAERGALRLWALPPLDRTSAEPPSGGRD